MPSGRKTDITGEKEDSFGDFGHDDDDFGGLKRDWPMALFIALIAAAVGML
ncbi:MAG: hypothetical protein NTX59_11165 [Elusimicrobia bacterium]|nr:hypothetical protein [Elusimicrobiota bacterium]